MPVTIINQTAGGGSPLVTIAPSAPGPAAPINGNILAGSRILSNIQSPDGEPSTADTPYYLLLDDGHGTTEHVIVTGRVGVARTILSPVMHTYSAGSATVAFAGLATSPASAGLLTALRHHELGQLDADGLNVQSGTITSPTSLTVQPMQATVAGAAKRDLVLRSGDGEASANGDSGDVVIDAGEVGDGATPGSIFIGQLYAAAVHSGNGTTPWTHDGDLSVTGDVTVTGQVIGANLVKHNFGAVTLPTASDDETKGYSVGSRWVVPGAGELVCLDATVGAAVWAVAAEANPSPVVEPDGSVPMTGALTLLAISDPGAETSAVRIYGKDVGGVTQLHAQSDDGTVHRLTGPKSPIIENGTSRTLTDDDDGRLILTTATVGPIVITVPVLEVGMTVEICQASEAQVQLVGDTGITLLYPASFLPHTAEQFSTIVVTIISPTSALVRGDLEAA